MDSNERKTKIADLRKFHEGTFAELNLVNPYFAAKYAHALPGSGDLSKFIGLYESEVSKGDDVYLEFVNMDYSVVSAERALYKWERKPNYKELYEVKKDQFMIPVMELKMIKTYPATVEANSHFEPPYKKTETETSVYISETYLDKNGTKHYITFKDDIPYVYTQQEMNKEEKTIITGSSLESMIKFFKYLKTKI